MKTGVVEKERLFWGKFVQKQQLELSGLFLKKKSALPGHSEARVKISAEPFEGFFGCAAHRAAPGVGKIFKFCSRRDFSFAIALVRVVNIPAIGHLALPHVFGIGHDGPPFEVCCKKPRRSGAD